MIKELDIVTLTHDLQEYKLLKGSYGTVVHCHEGGQGFEVEFIDPPYVLTLESDDIKLDKSVLQTQVVKLVDSLSEEALVDVRDFAEGLTQKHLKESRQ